MFQNKYFNTVTYINTNHYVSETINEELDNIDDNKFLMEPKELFDSNFNENEVMSNDTDIVKNKLLELYNMDHYLFLLLIMNYLLTKKVRNILNIPTKNSGEFVDINVTKINAADSDFVIEEEEIMEGL